MFVKIIFTQLNGIKLLGKCIFRSKFFVNFYLIKVIPRTLAQFSRKYSASNLTNKLITSELMHRI
jgi:hypothetical protein